MADEPDQASIVRTRGAARLSRRSCLLCLMAAATARAARAGDATREDLGSYPVQGGKTIDRMVINRLTFPAGFGTRPHTHPGPVTSYLVSGAITVQLAGAAARDYVAGQTIFEPAHTIVVQFRNSSATDPAIFVADYALGHEDTDLIRYVDGN